MSLSPRPSIHPTGPTPAQRRSLRRPPVDPALAALPDNALAVLFESARRTYREASTAETQARLFSVLAELSRRGLSVSPSETQSPRGAQAVRRAA